jgi:hypothetical protein
MEPDEVLSDTAIDTAPRGRAAHPRISAARGSSMVALGQVCKSEHCITELAPRAAASVAPTAGLFTRATFAAAHGTDQEDQNLPRVPLTGYGRGTQRHVLKSKTISGMHSRTCLQPGIIVGCGRGGPGVCAPISRVGAVETKPTARTTNSRAILMIFSM